MSARRKRNTSKLSNRKLGEHYLPFAARIVRQVMSRFNVPPGYFDDYLGAAYTGLLEAIERYNPHSEVPFENYAFLRVRGSVIDYIRQSSGFTPREYNAARLLRASDCLSEDFQQIKARIGEQDVDQSLAEVLDFAAKGGLIFRLNYSEYEEEIVDENPAVPTPEEITIDRQVQELIFKSVGELPPREQEIIYAYYVEGKTFQEIAEGPLQVTRSWVSRMHSRAIRILRKKVSDELKLNGKGECSA